MKGIYICFCLLLISFISTQAQSPAKLSGDEMDFWIGEWNLELLDDEEKQGRAENSITKILEGRVIEENYSGLEGIWENYHGKSLTVFDKRYNSFYQTWAANNGVYADYNFSMDGDKRIFSRETWVGPNKKIDVRMVFHSIEKHSFIWEWQSSYDEGKNWIVNSKVKYNRKEEFKDNVLSKLCRLNGSWINTETGEKLSWRLHNKNSLIGTVGNHDIIISKNSGNLVYKNTLFSKKLFRVISVTNNNFIALADSKDDSGISIIEHHILSNGDLRIVLKKKDNTIKYFNYKKFQN